MTASPPVITGLDHVIIAVSDLEAAASRWRALGFTVTPRGRHTGQATGNYCIMFANTYIELLGVVDASLPIPDFAPQAPDQEGMTGVALGMAAPEQLAAALDDTGIEHGGPVDLERDLELDTGTVRPRFINLFPARDDLPGFPLFYCHHLTPEMTRADPSWLDHENGATDIVAVHMIHPDPLELKEKCEQLIGTADSRGAGFSISPGGSAANETRFVFSPCDDFLQEQGLSEEDGSAWAGFPRFAALTIRTARDAGTVPPHQANGVGLFLQKD